MVEDKVFVKQFDKFLVEQKRGATGQRLEMLNRDLTGTIKMLEVLWPVFQTFEGIVLEYEIIGPGGVRIYIDAYLSYMRFGLESEGFGAHAETITRDRFSFEKDRVRALAAHRIRYIPFSKDQLDKRPDHCRRSMYELLGVYRSASEGLRMELNPSERELIRYMIGLMRPLKLADACFCLQMGPHPCRKVIRQLMELKLIRPMGDNMLRHHEYILEDKALDTFL